MGITLTFYAITLEDFLAVWLQEDENVFLADIDAIPKADFSLHLRFPDDLNDLWKCFHSAGIAVASSFEAGAELAWTNQQNEYIFAIHSQVTHHIAALTPEQILVTGTAWNGMYPELRHQSMQVPATYRAIQALQKVALYAVEAAVPLLLFVML